MKAIMGFTFFLLFLAGLAFVMLQGRQMAAQRVTGGGAGLAGINWLAESVGGEPVEDGVELRIRFDVDGSFNGHGGCNGFFGALGVTESRLEVGQMGVTSMACESRVMQRETTYLAAVGETASFEATETHLRLLDEDGDVLVTFVADTD